MFPDLAPSERSREYLLYDAHIRGRVAFEYLTTKKIGHREIDKNILGKDPKYTRGYQSMGILHYQGLKKTHCGKFSGKNLEEIINELYGIENASRLVSDLNSYHSIEGIDKEEFDKNFQIQVQHSYIDNAEKRLARLALSHSHKPLKVAVTTFAFIRNPDVVAEALNRSDGKCEECLKPAPFSRKSDGSPYLEVHHKVQLSQGGLDTISNVLALCPNCHRKFHYG
jgi:5-methylcytosine-specific restriction enzyme A